jgi:hypothetical protein
VPFIRKDIQNRRNGIDKPESRLNGLLWTAPLLPVGLFGFAWTSTGPPHTWIITMFFTTAVGVANYAIYMATIDYMVAAYGEYSASATGGNGFARDVLAGLAGLYSTPFIRHFAAPYTLSYPSTILACLGVAFIIPVYVFYWYGPQIRARSKFACKLAEERREELNNLETVEEVQETQAMQQPKPDFSLKAQETGSVSSFRKLVETSFQANS